MQKSPANFVANIIKAENKIMATIPKVFSEVIAHFMATKIF
jgi:hypothetical protein